MPLHVSCSKSQSFAEMHHCYEAYIGSQLNIVFTLKYSHFKAIHKIAPGYISNLINLKGSKRYSLRSSNTMSMLLSVPSGKF
jgi:hypothetical protein